VTVRTLSSDGMCVEGKTQDFQSTALPTELPSRFTYELLNSYPNEMRGTCSLPFTNLSGFNRQRRAFRALLCNNLVIARRQLRHWLLWSGHDGAHPFKNRSLRFALAGLFR